ncbi:MAG: hypothetical protein KJ811_01930, partial [Candidatus Margulisbacteria bacterium]|nr:hypothetical protein [Candidatus Margulisiibacteriota bacterium]
MCIGPECPGIQTPVIIPSRSNSKEEGPAPAPVAPRAICQEIVPDAGHTYIGAFPFPGDEEHVLTEAAISGFETMAGINDVGVDIGLRYLLMGMQGFSFPTADAQVMANPSRQGALFLKLEPWSPPGPDGRRGQEFTLAEIARGEHDERLRALAIQIRDFGGPVFFSFAHEMNFPEDSWYPWQGNPQEYIAAYRHVYELMSSITCNTTWVWNPGADSNYQTMMQYFPGERYVDWVALDGYDPRDQESAAPRRSFAETYDGLISALQPLNIPIMIGEFGSATFSNEDSTSRQPTYLTEAIDYIATTHERYTNPISAFVYFNTVSQTDEVIEMDWRITSPESQAALRTALDSHGEMFSGNIVTAPRDIAVSGLMRETNPIERFHTGEGQEATQWADHGDVSLQVPAAPGDFVAGLGVNLDNFIPPVGANTLEFNIRGNFASEGDYGHIVVQVFREGDDPGQNPASSIEIHNLTAGLTDYSVPLGTDTRPITKIQFLYVANGRGAEFEVTDLRFTASRP